MSVTRKGIPAKRRLQIFLAQSGKCWEPSCGAKLLPGQWQVDHRQALVHGGDDADDNLRAICLECHKKKTAKDVAANAKVKRLLGLTKKKRGPKIKSRGFQNGKRPWPKRSFSRQG